MRVALYAAASLAVALLVSPDSLRGALASSASALFEATPFLLGSSVLARLLRRPGAAAYLGCGCGGGPSARSLPAAVATALVFGPAAAAARLGAAIVVARILRRRVHSPCPEEPPELLSELAALLPSALLAGAATQFGGLLDPARLSPALGMLTGALLGFAAAPCALGGVAVAAALHARSPLASAAFLCVAGIVDLRALGPHRDPVRRRDALAYALLSAALAAVALRGGESLVHPHLVPAIGAAAAVALFGAVASRHELAPFRRVAPLVMIAGAFSGAPAPAYHATETTLDGLFPGERLTFTGTLVREAAHAALVRYAITCCRADAAPVVVRLAEVPPYGTGTWLRVDGRVDGELHLDASDIRRVPSPADPFVYR